MNEIVFNDVLLEETISFVDDAYGIEQLDIEESQVVESLFFPGCSFLNSSIELIEEVFQTLMSDHQVDGITLICCEKPLDFKRDMQEVKEAFSKRFRASLLCHGVKRIITACPNCFHELSKLVSQDAETEKIEIIDLPRVLTDCNHIVPASVAENLSPIAVHDACPDRKSGHYAESVRGLFPADLITELEHNKSRSLCCGALARAAGNEERAAKDADLIYSEAKEAEAQAIVVSCMSCSRLLAKAKSGTKGDTKNDMKNEAGKDTPIYHYLELVFGKRIDWRATPDHLIVRFRYEGLFDQVKS